MIPRLAGFFFLLGLSVITLHADEPIKPEGKQDDQPHQQPRPVVDPLAGYSYQRSQYRFELETRARALKLWNDPYWHKLLHYKPNRISGFTSEADGEKFFFAPEGKFDPREEMIATISAFFRPLPKEGANLHPQCLFPGRYYWLKSRLEFDTNLLPALDCVALKAWKAHFDPDSVSLVFASYFMDAPSSMFGHTLMTINSKENRKSSARGLLDYALNYAAYTGDLDPIRYVLYGLMGGYPGYFSLMAYHTKVREYSDLENRDLWEYRLSLNSEEIERLIHHFWDLMNTTFDYFYLRENCSYHLLSLIEVARPSLDLTSRFPSWVIPGETVKAVMESEGLVSEIRFRPSLRTEVNHRLATISESGRNLVYDLVSHKPGSEAALQGLPAAEASSVIDTAIYVLRYKKEPEKMNEEERGRYRKLLSLRAQLPVSESPVVIPIPEGTRPEHGHRIHMARVMPGAANSTGAGSYPFLDLTYQPVYHEYLGRPQGYAPFSDFLFLQGTARVYPDATVRFHELHFLRIATFGAYDRFSQSKTYFIDMGMSTEYRTRTGENKALELTTAFLQPGVYFYHRDAREKEKRERPYDLLTQAPNLEVLYGWTWRDSGQGFLSRFLFSGLAGVRAQTSRYFEGGGRAGPAAMLSVIYKGDAFRFQFSTTYYAYSVSNDPDDWKGAFTLHYTVAQNHEIRIRLEGRKDTAEGSIGYGYFF